MRDMIRPALLALALALLPAAARGDETPKTDEAPASEGKDWSEHLGDLPFIVGTKAGNAEAEFSGKPPMYFFTTTW